LNYLVIIRACFKIRIVIIYKQSERLCVCKWRGKMPIGCGQENAALVPILTASTENL